MKRRFLENLIRPVCSQDAPLHAVDTNVDSYDLVTGELRCERCGATFPVRDGILRFAGDDRHDCDNYAFQWREWRTVQIDRLGHRDLSERRFFGNTRWTPGWLRGRLILDAECGTGRFADIGSLNGATVIACDISDAIDAAAEIPRDNGERVACLQASTHDLPFKSGSFEVIQHRSNPIQTVMALPPLLKRGGRLIYNFYERGLSPKLRVVKYALRIIMPHFSRRVTLALSQALVRMFFPMARLLSRICYIRFANYFVRIAATHPIKLTRERQYRWTLLDTYDWYGPRYEQRQDHCKVIALLEDAGLVDVVGTPGLALARRPD